MTILVAGIGNVFMGDDGFGVAVAGRLAARPLRPGVVLMDAGIRGIDLTYALTDGHDAAILVDATPRGRAPGTLYVLEPALPEVTPEGALLDSHDLDPAKVLVLARALGALPRVVRIVGCEPSRVGTLDEPVFGLSDEVTAAVDHAVELVEELVRELHAAAKAIP